MTSLYKLDPDKFSQGVTHTINISVHILDMHIQHKFFSKTDDKTVPQDDYSIIF